MMAGMRRTAPVAPLACLLVAGCPWLAEPPPSGPPCEDDVTGCENNGEFVEDPSCELSGALDVELGEGEDVFQSLAPGELPEAHTGIQGGQHIWAAVRVKNPALDRPSLKLRIALSTCESDCDDPSSWRADNVRELVVGSRTLTVTPEGWFETASILVTLFLWGEAEHRKIELLVTDPCSRQGLVVLED